jgi:inosine-uridine nucleoside N-ribohydrolase
VKPTPLVIDTDCGVDDAVAILIALASPEVELLGLTTVAGNVGLDQVTQNVLRLLPHFGRGDVPVFRGASAALVEPPRPEGARSVHGPNGLGGAELPDAGKREEPQRAPEGLARLAGEHPGLTLLALGPLTNVAITLNLYPELKGLLGEIVCMGGALQRGNITPHAEFNFAADPEAVQFVLDSGVSLTVVPWDAALAIPHSEEELRALGLDRGRAGRLFFDMHRSVFAYTEQRFGRRLSMLPDPLTAAWLVDPTIARRTVRSNLRMELAPGERRGACLAEPGERLTLVPEIDKHRFDAVLLRIAGLQ